MLILCSANRIRVNNKEATNMLHPEFQIYFLRLFGYGHLSCFLDQMLCKPSFQCTKGSNSILEFKYVLEMKCTGILKVYRNALELKKCTGICTTISVWQKRR